MSYVERFAGNDDDIQLLTGSGMQHASEPTRYSDVVIICNPAVQPRSQRDFYVVVSSGVLAEAKPAHGFSNEGLSIRFKRALNVDHHKEKWHKCIVAEPGPSSILLPYFGLGFFWAIWDRDSQAWHDKLAGTVMIGRDQNLSRNYPSAKWPATVLLAFALAIFSLLIPAGEIAAPLAAQAIPASQPELVPQNEAALTNTASTSLSQAEVGAPEKLSSNADKELPNQENDVRPALDVSVEDQPTVDQPQIKQMLERWASAIESNDSSKTASYYGENVQRYFLARDFTREQVHADREAQAASGRHISSFQLSDLRFEEVTPSSAKVFLTKSYELESSGTAPVDRKTHSRLWLTNTEAGWKITGEQDLLK